ncbi:BrnT family toxin [Lichenihabitans sp. Uapishka_5]|uniref:BrnT family toxin n=1 Tax=Lichenihabitans sp. Uapishka_5 TaxID=3037302 RepID=UPI0029E7D92F|nr:BrnT family toxin [Lichenihabitans sp. Uapishka_5]MDX7952146.1 BrnT family toxin [Lichenihabitans sp. Uapishka_5]
MRIIWDEPKRRLNIKAHGLDFSDFEAGFDLETAIRFEAYASPTGRARYALIGWYRGKLVTVGIVSPLGVEALSLVSFRPASKKERAAYGF